MPPVIESVFELLFKYRPFVFEKGRFVIGSVWPALVILAVAALATAWSYGRAVGDPNTRRVDRLALAALRVAAFTLVLFCLCRPGLVLSTAVPQQSFVGILLDDSRSMRIADGGAPRSELMGRAFGVESALNKELAARFKPRFFRFAGTSDRVASASELTFQGADTDIVQALRGTSQELSGVPLAGLVLVTDGADNGEPGEMDDVLASLKARGVPVFTVGVGRERFASDVELTRVEMPSAVLKGTSVTAEVRVAQRGLGGQKVQLQVEDAGRIVQTQAIDLPRGGEAAAARVHFTASEAGPRTLRFKLAAAPGEPIKENNQQDVLVQVSDRREKILYLEGEPRFELKFIRRAVFEDKNLQVVCLQRTSQNKFLRLEIDDAEELAAGFPKTREELFRYRGIVLGSVEASFFTPDQLRMIAEFVGERGGGLLMLGGRHSFAEGGYANTSLTDVLPVVLEPGRAEEAFFADVKVEPTPFGMTHGVTQLAASEGESATRWSTLPTLSTVNPVRRTRPGAVTLLVGKGDRLEAPQVVLAYQRYGAGKALAFTAHDSWLWQMHAAVALEDMTHENLWRQLLRFLVSGVPGPVTVTLSPERTSPGSAVAVTATVRDETYIEVNDAAVVAHVTDPAGEERTVPLEWTVGKDGEYRGSFGLREKGNYAVRVEARRAGKVLGGETAQAQAADLDTEYFGAEMRKGLLERIAQETGGRFYTPETVSALPADLGYSGGGATVEEQKPLWDMPALYLLIVALVSAEWGFRKRRGLP
jgi:uncharacterized membrane protein